MPLIERLGGDAALGGIVSAFSIPVFNILAVIALTVFAEYERVDDTGGSGVQLSLDALTENKSPIAVKRRGANNFKNILLKM